MGTVKALVGLLVIIGVIYCAFQIIPPEFTNYSFQDDLRNIAMTGGANPHTSDQELIDTVIRKAQEHQITLAPEQITVQRIGSPGAPAVYLGADYSVLGNLAGCSFTLRVKPSRGKRGLK